MHEGYEMQTGYERLKSVFIGVRGNRNGEDVFCGGEAGRRLCVSEK